MRRRISIALLSFTIFIGWIDPASDKNEEGRQLYNEGEYDKAITRFTDTQLERPGLDSLDFNIADTHYKKGKFPEAEKSYRSALNSEDINLKTKANYNMGNTMYKQGKFNEALDYYRQAIKLTEEKSGIRGDEIREIREDSKYNYEFVQKKMEEMKKEQQERQDQEEQEKQDQKEEDQEEQDPQKQGEQQSEEEDSDGQQQQKNQEQEKQDKNDNGGQGKDPQQEMEKKQSPSQPYEKKEMTKEEAERILDALRQSEGSARHLQEKEDKSAQFMIEKNW